MNLSVVGWISGVLVIGVLITLVLNTMTSQENEQVPTSFRISSPEFENNGKIPSRYTCDGENISPPLSFSGVPKAAKTLALIMEDPDVPKSIRADGLWVHWVMFNLPAGRQAFQLEEGRIPEGVVGGLNTRGKIGYGGPCPPDREHRYFFKLYALDVELNLVEGASRRDEVLEAMRGHIVAEASLMGRYERIK